MTDLWQLVAAERGAFADDLAGLTEEQWNTPSLCPGWSVRDIVAHMTAAASTGPGAFLVQFATAGFNFDKYANAGLARQLGGSPTQTLAAFRAVQNSRTSPPGPKPTWVGEVVVHSEDARRPLGIRHTYNPEALQIAADFYQGSNTLIGAKNRIAGLSLKATDQEWTHGTGPLVEGPMLSLVLAMTGRGRHVDDLTGPGVEALRGRNR
ncbi:MAG TPA: maleylpyruvate isomerase family mycothiol-dependent enzyme [Pedococcus sp.]|jgi:uncharacterized protein (TIGR03083 family)|nr:maleylpyruvate isomerase family mycothiol-dependent enzyme [Pedococcus sp.]